MAARDGMRVLHGNGVSVHHTGRVCGGEVAGAQVRMGRNGRFGFGCSSGDVVVSTYCRLQRLTSSRQDALRSRPSDIVPAGEQPATAIELASFWDRLHEAWRVLLGTRPEAQVTKQRFSKLLLRDRGFNSTNLSRLYNVAKGAIEQHVELEHDGDALVTAVAERLGELRLDFRVRRVKSVLLDEPFAETLPADMDLSSGISKHQLRAGSRMIEDFEAQVGSSSALSDKHPVDELVAERNASQGIAAKMDGEFDKL